MRNISSAAVRGTGAYRYLNKPPRAFAGNIASAKNPVQNLIAGTDISARVERAQRVNGGFSGEVSRGKRPVHKAGSWKRV